MYSIGLSNYFDVFLLDGAIGAKPSIKPQFSEIFKTFVTLCHNAVWIPASAI